MSDWFDRYGTRKGPNESFNDSDSSSSDENTNRPISGKTFGSRGRGFLNPSMYKPSKSSSSVGRSNRNYEDGSREDRRDRRGRSERRSNWESRRRNDSPTRRDDSPTRRDDEEKGRGDEAKVKPKSTYIPEDPSDDYEEIFGNGISSGINFRKYDDIEVKVSGKNQPKPIKNFDSAGLTPSLVELIKNCNYRKPTPIQKYSIPIIMGGRDMMACAQTGSGKTAAFLIPIVNRLLVEGVAKEPCEGCYPAAIIVSPTRELAIQIFNEARKFSYGSDLKIAITYGGTAMFHQIKKIERGSHILVGTTGRLLDFVRRGTIKLSKVKFFVLDEADRMLDLGFLSDVEQILSHETMTPQKKRQTLMFSATFPEGIQMLAGKFMKNYLFVAVGIVGGACADVEQRFFCVNRYDKKNKVMKLLSDNPDTKFLIFVEKKRTTDFVATLLSENKFRATSIHGDREQREREEALSDFKSGRMDILVATSVAARGLDIKNVSHVVNYDLPKNIDEYVHRIGRTGRVGNRGLATSFYDPDADAMLAPDLVRVLKQAGQPVPEFLDNSGFCGSYEQASRFGGRDFRRNLGVAQESTFEEEEW